VAIRKLSKEDWVVAGFKALHHGGPQAIKIESIAKSMGVSKGSYYWHFKIGSDLKFAMLDRWVEIATKDVIKETEQKLSRSDQTLRYLVKTTSASLSASSKIAIFNESSIRDWARYDTDVAKVIKNVDSMRLEFVTIGFERVGFERARARENAKILYAALVGLSSLANHGLADIEVDLTNVLNVLLSTKPNR
jgi:AcrR family transcriptional regulator